MFNTSIYLHALFIILWILLIKNFSKRVLVDNYRNSLFEMRGKLFEYVKDSENITFNNEAYVLMRDMLNGYIRFAEKITLNELLRFKAYSRKYDVESSGNEDFYKHISTLSKKDQKFFEEIFFAAGVQTLKYMAFSSFMSLFVFSCILLKRRISGLVKGAQTTTIKDEFEEEGEETARRLSAPMVRFGRNNTKFDFWGSSPA